MGGDGPLGGGDRPIEAGSPLGKGIQMGGGGLGVAIAGQAIGPLGIQHQKDNIGGRLGGAGERVGGGGSGNGGRIHRGFRGMEQKTGQGQGVRGWDLGI